MAQRYGCLPSQVLASADTLDYLVMDIATSHERYQQEQQEARRQGRAPTPPNIPINTLQEMMDRVRR